MRELDEQIKNIIISGEWISSKNERMGLTTDNGDREKKKKRKKKRNEMKGKQKEREEWKRMRKKEKTR